MERKPRGSIPRGSTAQSVLPTFLPRGEVPSTMTFHQHLPSFRYCWSGSQITTRNLYWHLLLEWSAPRQTENKRSMNLHWVLGTRARACINRLSPHLQQLPLSPSRLQCLFFPYMLSSMNKLENNVINSNAPHQVSWFCRARGITVSLVLKGLEEFLTNSWIFGIILEKTVQKLLILKYYIILFKFKALQIQGRGQGEQMAAWVLGCSPASTHNTTFLPFLFSNYPGEAQLRSPSFKMQFFRFWSSHPCLQEALIYVDISV